jgi:hypothetical protein
MCGFECMCMFYVINSKNAERGNLYNAWQPHCYCM